MQYLGIALAVIVLILIVAFIIYKKTHKDRVEVIVVKENNEEDNEFKPRPNFAHPPPGAPPTAASFKPNMGRPPFGPSGGSRPIQPMPFSRPPAQDMGAVN